MVGGGKVAERKVKNLLASGATVIVVSPALTEWLEEAAAGGNIAVARRGYVSDDLKDVFLAIGATDNHRINRTVAADCQKRNIPVNIVDNPAECSFIVPAVLRRGSLSVSISTDGKSPMLARRIRERLESEFGPEYDEFLELMAKVREYLISNVPDEEQRRNTFRNLVDSDIVDLIKQGRHEKVKERITHVLGNGWTQS